MSVNVQRGACVSTMATWRLRSREISFRVGAGIFTAAGTFIVNALLRGDVLPAAMDSFIAYREPVTPNRAPPW